MLIIEVKENENIDRALKRYKRKFQTTGVMKELRSRKEFKKPSTLQSNYCSTNTLHMNLHPRL